MDNSGLEAWGLRLLVQAAAGGPRRLLVKLGLLREVTQQLWLWLWLLALGLALTLTLALTPDSTPGSGLTLPASARQGGAQNGVRFV